MAEEFGDRFGPYEQPKDAPVQSDVRTGDIDALSGRFLLADASDVRNRAETLNARQCQERQDVENRYSSSRSDVRAETCRNLWKSPETVETPSEKVARAKKELYAALGISEKSEASDRLWKFKLWLADWLVGDNVQTVEELLKIWLDKVAEALLKIFDSLEWIKEFILVAWERFLEDVANLASLEPYDTWKAVGGLGFWVIGSLGRSLWKAAVREAAHDAQRGALERGVMDVLDWKGRYMLPMNAHPNVMREKVVEFVQSMDIRYLANHPERIGHMADIVNHMAEYTVQNAQRIRGLRNAELNAYKADFMEMYNSFTRLSNSPDIPAVNARTMGVLRNWTLKDAYYSLYPNFAPNPN